MVLTSGLVDIFWDKKWLSGQKKWKTKARIESMSTGDQWSKISDLFVPMWGGIILG